MLGTLGEIPSNAVQILEEMGVRGTELDRLIEDIHMIAVNKAGDRLSNVYKKTRFRVMKRFLESGRTRVGW